MHTSSPPPSGRRHAIRLGAGLLAAHASAPLVTAAAATTEAAAVEVRPRRLVFPRDSGAHPEFRTEWWYITGWVGAEAQFGFQITFFRSRVDDTQRMRSRLAARQIVFAHAAITDVKGQRLWHDQRMARWSGEAPGRNPADSASASMQDTGLVLRDWSLLREGANLRAKARAREFAMDLTLVATQERILQGDQGLSRKGPDPRQASYYYSLPHLRVGGSLVLQGRQLDLSGGGTAWLDHEWSEEILSDGPEAAVGWDWIGINMLDGGALTAFQLRNRDGVAVWDGGSFRSGSSQLSFQRGDVSFEARRFWQSPASRARYPVEWLVRTPAGPFTVKAAIDNQELDSTASTGAIYWEGLCAVWDREQRLVGRGYLEMTGYASPLRMRS